MTLKIKKPLEEGRMTLSKFCNQYFLHKIDFDGAFGAQCVDLVRQYFKDVWNLARQPEGVVGAEDFFTLRNTRPLQEKYTQMHVFKEEGANPPPGSVVIFKSTPTNKYGHIAVCVYSDRAGMVTFEQNGFSQEGAEFVVRDYKLLLGWMNRREVLT